MGNVFAAGHRDLYECDLSVQTRVALQQDSKCFYSLEDTFCVVEPIYAQDNAAVPNIAPNGFCEAYDRRFTRHASELPEINSDGKSSDGGLSWAVEHLQRCTFLRKSGVWKKASHAGNEVMAIANALKAHQAKSQ